ncbi:MAG: hypothetical protein JXB49_37240 [Bacteroidales bacterium]|nr:hypothetical protein [Bacteroidales bacterium]
MKDSLKEIKPGYGLGNIKFGITRNEVKAILGEPDDIDAFSYTGDDENLTETWIYGELELTIGFDQEEDWRLVMLTIASDFYTLNGKSLIGLNREELERQLKQMNIHDIEFEDMSSDDEPNQVLLEADSLSINFWLDEDRLDEIQWSPVFIDDDTIKWPE